MMVFVPAIVSLLDRVSWEMAGFSSLEMVSGRLLYEERIKERVVSFGETERMGGVILL